MRGYADPNKAGLGWEPQFQYKLFPTKDIGIDVFTGVSAKYADIGAGSDPFNFDYRVFENVSEPFNREHVENYINPWDRELFERLLGSPAAKTGRIPTGQGRGLLFNVRNFEYGSVNVETPANATNINLGPFAPSN